jgi:hypothetical protein
MTQCTAQKQHCSVQQQRTDNVLRTGRVPDVVRGKNERTGTPWPYSTRCSAEGLSRLINPPSRQEIQNSDL